MNRFELDGVYGVLLRYKYQGAYYYKDFSTNVVWDATGKLRYEILEMLQEQERREDIENANFV